MRSNDSQKIIVVGIPKTLDDAQLSELFSDFGAVAEAKVVLDAASNTSRGFGFVTFTAGSAMRAAIKGMNRKVVQGRTLNVRQLVPKDQFQKQQSETADVSQRPCWLLRKGKCTKGANCPFSHDIKDGEFGNCFEFVQTGECKRGDNCKFNHPEKEQEGEEVAVKKETQKQKPEKRVCYSFQNGRCHRGKKCLYAHELLANGDHAGDKQEKKEKKTFEVVNEKTEAGKKRKREEESDEEEEESDEKMEEMEVKKEKSPPLSGLAAHVSNFMAGQKKEVKTHMKPQLKQKPRQNQEKPNGPKKFEWKAKTQISRQQEERQEEVQHRPVKKMKTEKVDMGAAFDDLSDDESRPARGGKKKKVDKETMRANREKLKQERRAKRNAKKSALSKLQMKGEVELDS
ncbi:Zinc finger CCCH domain-containing protein 42 [Phytophthora citrophthora]|uniref:Zinc finger CCCH domain-containing protein 42 n=1 Tax=Phytophthora citrophthora TaxID=4793 RepID=A0AAD9LFM8_9STRA|nr:Zinc finger CCCH domain-containing protein 42 [Phytophthora citrophthora]